MQPLASPDPIPPRAAGAAEIAKFEARKLSIVRAAYEIIAEKGFENLRTREVAQRAGVNVATLHYYFPSKQTLVAAVALYLASKFETLRAPAAPATIATSPLDRLRQEFADAALYLGDRPEMIEVMRELLGRSQRDLEVANIIAPLKQAWQRSLEEIIEDGISDGAFTAAISPRDAAGVIVAMLWGAATFPVNSTVLDHARSAVERWLAAPTTEERAGK